MCHFSFLLEQASTGPPTDIKAAMAASPPLRNHFIRIPVEQGSSMFDVARKSDKKDYLLWLLLQLADNEEMFRCGLHNLIDEVERVTSEHASQAARISSHLASTLSDLAIISELRRQLALSRPGLLLFDCVDKSELHSVFNKQAAPLVELMNLSRQLKLEPYGTPLSKFKYPSEKRRTATTTKAMRDAEDNLDTLWKQVDDLFLDKTRMSLHDFSGGVMGQRELMRTAEWVEHPPKPRKAGPGKDIDFLPSLLSTTSLEPATHQTPPPPPPPPPKTKLKTRGIPGEPTPSDAQAAEDTTPALEDPKITVSKRAYKVFATLFRSPTEDGVPGETPWVDFLHAMASAGFSAEKVDGSAWVLAPREDEFRCSIVFHEPHPYSRIPFRMARRYGRRLGRVFGVGWEDFCSS